MVRDISHKWKQTNKKAGMAILIPDKTDFKRKSIATDKKWP